MLAYHHQPESQQSDTVAVLYDAVANGDQGIDVVGENHSTGQQEHNDAQELVSHSSIRSQRSLFSGDHQGCFCRMLHSYSTTCLETLQQSLNSLASTPYR